MGLTAVAQAFNPADYPVHPVVCNLCGGNDVTTVATQDRYGFPTRIVRCDHCGLEYQSPRMVDEGFAALYRGRYRPLVQAWLAEHALSDHSGEAGDAYPAGLAYFARRWLPVEGALLDIGGSTGKISAYFAALHGYAVTVLDPAMDELAQAKGRLIAQSVEEAEFPPQSFPVILCCRTLDHCLDPTRALTKMRQWIAPNGVLICDVVNVAGWAPTSRYKLDHPYAFTTKTFGALLLKTGWKIHAIWKSDNARYVGVVAGPA